MKHIFLNLKRFDVPVEYGGVNRTGKMENWGSSIVSETQEALARYAGEAEFVQFFPEAHLLAALKARVSGSPVCIGSQGVYREDTAPGGNFGAFTTNRTANAVKALGCGWTLIGHCEERNDKAGIIAEASAALAGAEAGKISAAVNRILNKELLRAREAGLRVLFCVGEKSEEQADWEKTLGGQLDLGLGDANRDGIVIAYEPVWSIGPGKKPADKEYIAKVAGFIKKHTGGMEVVYGGGLKADNAAMLASIPEIDGGLIALTRFAGDIGFYPAEYLEIIEKYLRG